MNKTFFSECRYILLLWLTQALSNLGSAMTNFALVVWSYSQYGSALTTAMLTVCAYAPLCGAQYFRRGPQRPMEQEEDHAGV